MFSSHRRPGRLVLYGRDNDLLHHRSLVLSSAGFRVSSMVNHQKLVALLSDQEKCFELLILCHTVVMEERHSLNQIANELGIPTYQVIPLISPAALIAELLIVLGDREYESLQTAGGSVPHPWRITSHF